MSACPDCPRYDGNRNPDIPLRSACCLDGRKEDAYGAALAKAKEDGLSYSQMNRHERRKAASLERRRRA